MSTLVWVIAGLSIAAYVYVAIGSHVHDRRRGPVCRACGGGGRRDEDGWLVACPHCDGRGRVA